MLADELIGRPFNKSAHRRALKERLDRSEGSLEFKHQNISAVLKGLGEAWIAGYKPAFNFQDSLIDAVARYLAKPNSAFNADPPVQNLNEGSPLFIGPPPTLQNALPPEETEQMMAVARRFDVAGRDERNRELGEAGERMVLDHETTLLRSSGRTDLAEQVRWTSKQDGDGAGYDIASFDVTGEPRLIEVKSTRGWERTPFYISRNELAVSKSLHESWCLVRVYDLAKSPRAYELRPPLERHIELIATSYEARIR